MQTSRASATSKSIDKTIDKAVSTPEPAIANGPLAEIDLSAIAGNYTAIDRFASAAETGAVVKAKAYGHGLEEVGTALSNAGCRSFYVAYAEEGAALRAAVGSGPAIYVFHSLLGDDLSAYRDHDLRPILNRVEDVYRWLDANGDRFAVKLDTGMNRLGMRPEDVGACRIALGTAKPDYLISHIASADDRASPKNAAQLKLFHDVTAGFPGVKRSLSATAGIYLGPDYHFDIVRPGIGLYGGGPPPPKSVTLAAGMRLTATVLAVFRVGPGETTGYGATKTFDRSATLATLSIGYADGFPRSASNKGAVMIDRKRCPIVGRVSMDMITVDVSKTTNPSRLVGETAEIFGPSLPLETQATAAGTLGYELTSALGSRISRRWIRSE